VPRAVSRELFDPEAILRVLAEHGVEFVVVGGIAVQTHGYVRPTRDLDIIPRPDLVNLSRLGEALAELDSRLYRTQRPLDMTDPQILKRAALVPLVTTYGRLDIMNIESTAGKLGRYSDLRERAIDVDLGTLRVAVMGLDDLIRMKKATGREQDRIDIGALTALDEDLAREAGEST
jgi:predicted nucleotidyltransferase